MASAKFDVTKLSAELTKAARGLAAEAVVTLQKKTTFDVLAGVIKRTPVDEGTARGGWLVGIGLPPDGAGIIDKGELGDPSGAALNSGLSVMAQLEPYQIVYITNNVEYIVTLDQGGFIPPDPGPSRDPRKERKGKVLVRGGYSTQAPQGMVDVTLASMIGGG